MGTKTSGFKEYNKKLTNMQRNIKNREKKLQERALKVSHETMLENVPVDTGELKESIELGTRSVTVNSDYGAPVEYGTFKMSAQPYVRPAYTAMKEYVEDNYKGVVK